MVGETLSDKHTHKALATALACLKKNDICVILHELLHFFVMIKVVYVVLIYCKFIYKSENSQQKINENEYETQNNAL